MSESNPKTLLYSGTYISVIHLKEMLEADHIIPLIEDDKASGIAAGFGGGTDSTVRLFVAESDFEKANSVLKAFEQE